MLTIFQLDGINAVKAIMVVVFPDAVSPLINTLIPSASIIHRYAASIESSDLLGMTCVMDSGVLANLLIVAFVPFLLTSFPNTMLILEPSGSVASMTGFA